MSNVAEPDRARTERVSGERPPGRARLGFVLVVGLLVGLVIGGLVATLLARTGDDAFGGALDTTRYQAVIVSNDKVYFGRLTSLSSDFYQLRDAFFLRETSQDPNAEPVHELLPVNREIHGPENSMLIRKDEVVLVENLAEDSPVLAEILHQRGRDE